MRISEDARERKEIPIFSGFLKYFPLAIAAVARHSFVSNGQHNPGEPLHWAREKSTDETDALARHLVDMAMAEEVDDVKQQVEDATAIAWRAMANLQKLRERQINQGNLGRLINTRRRFATRPETADEGRERLARLSVHQAMRELRLKDD